VRENHDPGGLALPACSMHDQQRVLFVAPSPSVSCPLRVVPGWLLGRRGRASFPVASYRRTDKILRRGLPDAGELRTREDA
jgi:hypothetical protein